MSQINLVTTQIEQSPPEPIQPNQPHANSSSIAFSVIYLAGFIAIWGAAFWSVLRPKRISSEHRTNSRQEDNIPCRTCEYFHNNYYLKCAVNPLAAMTEAAINCCDYCPSQQKSRWRR